jgi:large subunit ribosomal protein L19
MHNPAPLPHFLRIGTDTMATLSIIQALESAALRKDLPEFRVGDTVSVHYKIVEGDKLRVQVFKGVVI